MFIIDIIVWMYSIYLKYICKLWIKPDKEHIYGIHLTNDLCIVNEVLEHSNAYLVQYVRENETYHQLWYNQPVPQFIPCKCKLMSGFIEGDIPVDISIHEYLVYPNLLFTPVFNQWLCNRLQIPYSPDIIIKIFDSHANIHTIDSNTRLRINEYSIALERDGEVMYIEDNEKDIKK